MWTYSCHFILDSWLYQQRNKYTITFGNGALRAQLTSTVHCMISLSSSMRNTTRFDIILMFTSLKQPDANYKINHLHEMFTPWTCYALAGSTLNKSLARKKRQATHATRTTLVTGVICLNNRRVRRVVERGKGPRDAFVSLESFRRKSPLVRDGTIASDT